MQASKSTWNTRHKLSCLLVCLCTLVMFGCGPSDGRLPVAGVIICDGQPLAEASVAFVGGGGGAISTGSTDKDGRFSIRAAPGKNKVSVAKMDSANAAEWADIPEEDQLAGTPEEMAQAMKNAPKPLVAQRYFNSETSGIEYDVVPNMAEVTIEVTKQ